MRSGARIALLALCALLAGSTAFSGANFTAVSHNPNNDFATAANFSSITVTLDDPGANLRGTVTLNATASDSSGALIVSVVIQRSPAGADTWTDVCTDLLAPYSCSLETAALSDGLHDFRAVATNSVAASATSNVVVNRRVDNTRPAVAIADPGAHVRGTISLEATASDTGGSGVVSVVIQRSSAGANAWTDVCTDATSPYSCSLDTTALTDGLYDFRAVATDNAGNADASTTTNRRIDNTRPDATMSDPGSPIAGTKTLSGDSTDSGSGVASWKAQYSVAGADAWTDVCTDTASPYSCSLDTTALTDGLYDFRAIATDNAANSGASTAWASRRVDNYAPTVTMSDPGANLRGTVTTAATAADGGGVASVAIQRAAAGANTWMDVCTDTTSPYSCSLDTTALADGLYDFRAIATDNAGRKTTSAAVTSRRVDNTAPATTMTDPGTPIKASVTLSSTTSDGGSGVASVRYEYTRSGGSTWSAACNSTVAPYSCSFDTATIADGSYSFRAFATDKAGNVQTSGVVANRVVDNALPKGFDVQTTNGGATAGKAEANDTVTFTYSEEMSPSSLLAGWTGAPTAVTVRIIEKNIGDELQVWDGTNTKKVALTGGGLMEGVELGLAGDYVPVDTTFSATMVQSGSSIVVTLGTLTSGAVNANPAVPGVMEWTPSSAATDLAGNACSTSGVLESGLADVEF